MKPSHRLTKSLAARAFTLVELLIVIGIIAILISILLPVIAKVRIAARTATTQASITRIAAGMEAYFADFNAYPGPFGNAQLLSGGTPPVFTIINHPNGTIPGAGVTSTENVMVGLIGRLKNTAVAGAAPVLVYDWNNLGQGPASLNPLNTKNSGAYINFQARELSSTTTNERATTTYLGQWVGGDSPLPELLDGYSNPQPILCIRANRGNPGIAAADNSAQYNTNQLILYGFPAHQTSPTGYSQQYRDDFPANGVLTEGEEAYFGNASLSTAALKQPQRKDAYILISAGPDGVFGTKDDIRNFGNSSGN